MNSPHKGWAYALMVREAGGEEINIIAAEFWREALGLNADADAKQVLESIKRQQAAA